VLGAELSMHWRFIILTLLYEEEEPAGVPDPDIPVGFIGRYFASDVDPD
jgi:hypothetical protein